MNLSLDKMLDELWHLSTHLAWQLQLDQERAFSGLGLSPMQAFTLMCVAQGIDQPSSLGFVLSTSPPGVSQMLASLEERALVRRELDSQNKRKVRVLLTEQGEEVLERMRENWKKVSRERFARLDLEEVDMLRRIYLKLNEPLNPKDTPPTQEARS
ncbi:MarR family winged helix-turn-helix transcriptional regulator [Meiothermus rufus]|uniref:MarR family winged helix-turn-helix transcriptional regulator n=1 Tax=Meiothermus rufus TaxID=604332 RepID=UPI0006874977|nr:winged helix DNA-binding protein [Meiothermus rufus]